MFNDSEYSGRVFATPTEFRAIARSWQDLHTAASGAPFSDLNWIDAWSSVFWDRSVVGYIATVWQDETLVAALPLRLVTARVSRRFPFRTRTLQMLHDDRVGFHDILIRPGHEAAANVLFHLCLQSQARYMDLTPLMPSDALDAFRASAKGRWQHTRVEIESAIADIRDGWDAFVARRSRSNRKTSRQIIRRCHDAGMTGTGVTRNDPQAAKTLDAVFTVSSRSWKAINGTDIGSQSSDRAFFRALFDGLTGATTMQLYVLWHAGKPIASSVTLRSNGTNYGLVTDYDADYADFAVGRRITLFEIEQACILGDHSIDHLRATPFTRTLSDDTVDLHRLRIALRPGFARWIISAEFGLRAVVERLLGDKKRLTGRLKFMGSGK